ncbi:MAG: hypothetical protein SOR79_09935 [Blautia sp.]|uniref:hypothetical protein n=1 Tax=Blautia sp. TaxID=1955243 RepID=UPI002A75E30F|nr:hypothetical protein [Blautia sp.]MDY3017452.1 hypothetical protein [Blautia sp.]
MITIFKNKKDIPQDKEYIELNDIFFNQNTAAKLDNRAENDIEQVKVQTSRECKVIEDYEELKEWWENEE